MGVFERGLDLSKFEIFDLWYVKGLNFWIGEWNGWEGIGGIKYVIFSSSNNEKI